MISTIISNEVLLIAFTIFIDMLSKYNQSTYLGANPNSSSFVSTFLSVISNYIFRFVLFLIIIFIIEIISHHVTNNSKESKPSWRNLLYLNYRLIIIVND